MFGADVSVQRHGSHAQLLGYLGQRRGFQTALVGEPDSCTHHCFDIERGLAAQAMRDDRQPPEPPKEVGHCDVTHAIDPPASMEQSYMR